MTLSYTQSLDGVIVAQRGARLALGSAATLKITHRLRARHSAILIGIGTLLADDPQLNVRLVSGADPQPVVLDRQLRFPMDAHLLRGQKSPWIFTTLNAQPECEANLTKAGHVFFGPFGEFIGFLGGTLMQLIVPLTFLGYFLYKRDQYAASVLLWWVG